MGVIMVVWAGESLGESSVKNINHTVMCGTIWKDKMEGWKIIEEAVSGTQVQGWNGEGQIREIPGMGQPASK